MTTTNNMLREAQAKLKEAVELIAVLMQDERLKYRDGTTNDIRLTVKAELAYNHARSAEVALSEFKKIENGKIV